MNPDRTLDTPLSLHPTACQIQSLSDQARMWPLRENRTRPPAPATTELPEASCCSSAQSGGLVMAVIRNAGATQGGVSLPSPSTDLETHSYRSMGQPQHTHAISICELEIELK